VKAAASAVKAARSHSRFGRGDKGSHQGQRRQANYGRLGQGVSHRSELQSFRVQRRKAKKVPFSAGSVQHPKLEPLSEAFSL
jgi:hypothetical protein